MLGSELPAGTYTVSQFAWEMKGLLGDTYPSVWIAGEVQRLRPAARGQIYFELVEKGRGDRVQAKLDCVIWADDQPKVEAVLREAGVELSEGVVLRCAGRPDFWPGGGRFQFVVSGVDPLFSLGARERRRRETLRALQAAGLLELNKRLPLAPAPLDIGLVTSEGSAAYHDFLHTLEQSGFGFRVVLVHAAVQGAAAEAEIGRAFELLKAFARDGGRLDAIALIRGGGSRADLATFDSRRVARAVAEADVPVICGVGHQIDVSISDLVAHTTCKTPTEAAELLVGRVGGAAYGVEETARVLARQARDVLRVAENRVSQVTHRFASPSRALLVTRAAHCRAMERDLTRSAKRTLADAERLERERRTRLLRGAFLPVRRAARQMEAHRRLCEQLSPERTLARGFSLTRRADGRLVRSVGDVAPGAELLTRVRGGAIRSRVLGTEEDAGQKDLLSTKERT